MRATPVGLALLLTACQVAPAEPRPAASPMTERPTATQAPDRPTATPRPVRPPILQSRNPQPSRGRRTRPVRSPRRSQRPLNVRRLPIHPFPPRLLCLPSLLCRQQHRNPPLSPRPVTVARPTQISASRPRRPTSTAITLRSAVGSGSRYANPTRTASIGTGMGSGASSEAEAARYRAPWRMRRTQCGGRLGSRRSLARA